MEVRTRAFIGGLCGRKKAAKQESMVFYGSVKLLGYSMQLVRYCWKSGGP